MKFLELLSESNGSLSSMRLSMLGCVVVALFIAVYQVVNRIEPESLELILVLLGAGFTAKVAQKVVEEKKDTPPQ